jgi:hypothetical protein
VYITKFSGKYLLLIHHTGGSSSLLLLYSAVCISPKTGSTECGKEKLALIHFNEKASSRMKSYNPESKVHFVWTIDYAGKVGHQTVPARTNCS